MLKKIIINSITIFVLVSFPTVIYAAPTKIQNFQDMKSSKISSYSAAVIDSESGELLFGKREDEKKPVASITKIVGAYVFLEKNPNLNKNAKMAKGDEVGGGRLKLPVGTTMAVKNFLYSSLVGSANNAATALIRLSGLEKSSFVNKMNNFAESAGAEKAKFVDACGISPENQSTAKDMALIGAKVYSNQYLCKVSAKKRYSFKINNGKGNKSIVHTSSLVSSSNSKFKVLAAKTGYLPEVGNNLLAKLESKKDRDAKIIVVTFGAKNQSAAARDITNLAKWAFKNYKWN
jgi:D-alanyl-D-alanine endopeptidase (penicillin-binding protein 7)